MASGVGAKADAPTASRGAVGIKELRPGRRSGSRCGGWQRCWQRRLCRCDADHTGLALVQTFTKLRCESEPDGGKTPGAGGAGSAGGLSKYKKLAPSFRNGWMGPMHARRSGKAACGRPETATPMREQLASRPCVGLADGRLLANGPGRMVARVVMAQWGFRASAASDEAGLLFGYQQEFPQSGPQFRRDWQGAVGGLRHGRRQTKGNNNKGRGSREAEGQGGDGEPQNAVTVEVDKQTWCFPTKEAAAPSSCEDEGKGGDCRSGFAGRGICRGRGGRWANAPIPVVPGGRAGVWASWVALTLGPCLSCTPEMYV